MKPADSHTSSRPVDAEWVRAVVDEYETPLLRHAVRLLRGDLERARDVVQDTFLKLWQADRSSIESHLAQWLFTVSRNRALDVLRKERRMTSLNGQLPEEDAELNWKPERRTAREEGTRQAIELLDQLPDRESEAIRLKIQSELSYKEIAEVMGITVSHVGVLIHTGLKSIRERLTATRPQASASIANIANPRSGDGGGGEVLT